jgi:DNA-binding MarR family transcriptional regulator
MSALKQPARHDDLLNFQLRRLVRLGGAPAVRLCEGRYGVARQEWRLTAALVERGPMSVGALADYALVEAARVSRMVPVLVRKGLVARTAGRSDARKALLSGTERGHRLYAELLPQLAAINRRLTEVLTEQEALLLEDLLARLTAQALRIHAEGGGVAAKAQRHVGGATRTWLQEMDRQADEAC